MFNPKEYFEKEKRPLKEGKYPEENNQPEEIETVVVGQPGLDSHLAAETTLGENQLEVRRLDSADFEKPQAAALETSLKNEYAREEEVKAIREILKTLSESYGQDQIMEVKSVAGLDLNGEKFTITESNKETVEKILIQRGYEIIDIANGAPELGFRARKIGAEDKNLDLVFLISRKK